MNTWLPDPLRDPNTDDEPWPPTQMERVTPVGCWFLAALLVLLGIAAILAVTRPWEGRA